MTDRICLTPEQAEGLLKPGDNIHNFANPNGMLVGCDYSREKTIDLFKRAHLIVIGGDSCKSMSHPIVVFETEASRPLFFEADMERVNALEEAIGA